jgi:AraC-like DNA-binding protein
VHGRADPRLGKPPGITPNTRRLLYQERINGIIRQHLGNPALDPDEIAKQAHISPRYLHTIFQGADLTPMQLVKQLRLHQAHHRLQIRHWPGRPLRTSCRR